MTIETIRALLHRVWAGDAEAAARFVRQHGAEIRRLARLHLTDPRPCRVGDSPEVWQSVVTMFLERAAVGRLDLEKPEQLRLLLNALSRGIAPAPGRPAGTECAVPALSVEEVCDE